MTRRNKKGPAKVTNPSFTDETSDQDVATNNQPLPETSKEDDASQQPEITSIQKALERLTSYIPASETKKAIIEEIKLMFLNITLPDWNTVKKNLSDAYQKLSVPQNFLVGLFKTPASATLLEAFIQEAYGAEAVSDLKKRLAIKNLCPWWCLIQEFSIQRQNKRLYI